MITTFFYCQPADGSAASVGYDSQTTIRGISVVFAQERFEDGEAEESGDFFFAGCGEEA